MDAVMVRSAPIREIVIMEQTRFSSPDELARFASISGGGKTAAIYWAKGVTFIYYPLPTTTEVAAKAIIQEKKVYWAFVSYAPMPEYQPLIETKEKIIVPVINMSTSPMFQQVAQWLTEQK